MHLGCTKHSPQVSQREMYETMFVCRELVRGKRRGPCQQLQTGNGVGSSRNFPHKDVVTDPNFTKVFVHIHNESSIPESHLYNRTDMMLDE